MSKSIIGSKYGRLTVTGEGNRINGRIAFLCNCECGNTKMVMRQSLISGGSKSCGCIKKKYNHPYGYSEKTYKLWHTMIRRCYNKKTNGFSSYGAKGITVCDNWMGINGFVNFMSDMSERPTELHSIDRIDNEQGYSSNNCRWATKIEQANNTRSNRKMTVNGVTKNLCQWADENGINRQTVSERLKRGWSDERAATEKVNGWR